jgi:acyl-CoA dehydrogenase
MILLARTTPIDQVKKRSEGLSVFMVDLHHAIANGLTVRPIPTMMNHETNELFLQDVEVPVENLIGEEGKGFKYILDGMIAERTMVAGEAIGDGYWFVNRAVKYANERVVFDRPIGKNQGIAFPIAQAYAHVRAADLMRFDAAQKFDAGIPAGTEANLAKHLAAEASWEAADVAMQTLGGYGVAEEYDVERKFRETRLFRIAPLSTNLILSYIAEHVLGLPRSY